ncbi:hypothetical protein Tco_1082993 [Tanacetum coccineum]|uniref:Reverse transcriptase domain-containing protein n=1 Tax=Tanacetum coccineum TaxID=301880 RepID=A0ABQ5I439_9ASTR
MSASDPEALSRDVAASSHLRKRVRKGKLCSKGWKKVYSTGSETKVKVCPYTQTTQGVGRTTVATGTLKAATKVLDQEQQSPLLRDVITKGYPREEQRSCQKARVAPERDGESTKEFVRRYKLECRDITGAPECLKISGFMHGITNPELIKRLHDKIPKSVDEMMRVTTAFLRGEVVASNRERKKSFPSWKQQEANQKQNFKKRRLSEPTKVRKEQDRFALLTKSPKEIFASDKGKFKAPPPMTTPIEKINANKFFEFHGEVGHNTKECMHLRKQIEEMLKAGKLSHLIREIKQNNGKEQPKVTNKGETVGKDKAMAILMVQPWGWVARQRITQSFSPNSVIFFPPLGEDEGTKGPIIIEEKIGDHCVHHIYVDGGSASEILYGHCFSRLRLEIKKQLIPATTPLIRFSGEIIWPIGQIQLLVTIGDGEHSALALMNFVVVRSPSRTMELMEDQGFGNCKRFLQQFMKC